MIAFAPKTSAAAAVQAAAFLLAIAPSYRVLLISHIPTGPVGFPVAGSTAGSFDFVETHQYQALASASAPPTRLRIKAIAFTSFPLYSFDCKDQKKVRSLAARLENSHLHVPKHLLPSLSAVGPKE